MKKLQTQLKSIAKNLTTLSTRLDAAVKQVEKLSAAKPAAAKKAKPAAKKKAPAKKVVKKAAKKTVAKKAAPKKAATVLDQVFDVIRRSRNGATIATLKAKTKLESRQLSNALYKLSKKGKITSKSRGVYTKA